MSADDATLPAADSVEPESPPAGVPAAAEPQAVQVAVESQAEPVTAEGQFGAPVVGVPGEQADPSTSDPKIAPVVPRPRKKLWLSLGAVALVVVLLAVGYTAVRFLVDLGSYHDGHDAYVRADCAAAVSEFDSVIDGGRIVTLGETVDSARKEKAECLDFKVAADKQQRGDRAGALASYATFVPGRPSSPLTDAARMRVAEMLGQPDLAGLATAESCDTLDVLREQKMLVADSAPGFYAACGSAYARARQPTTAAGTYAKLFTEYPDHKVAGETEAKIAGDSAWCEDLVNISRDEVLSTRGDLLPGLLLTCLTTPITNDDAPLVEALAQLYLNDFPGRPRTGEVMAVFARKINKAARGNGQELGAPPGRSVGGNKAVILLYNDSNDPLRVALSGPEPMVDTVDRCPTCLIEPAGSVCRPEAVLKRLVVEPGEYDVAFTRSILGRASFDLNIRDSFLHWNLQPGKEYVLCLATYRE